MIDMPQFADEPAWKRLHEKGEAKPLLDQARSEGQARLSQIAEELRGATTEKEYGELRKRRVATLHFMKLVDVQNSKLKSWRNTDAVKAIEKHRFETRKAEIVPELHDLALWAVLGDENTPLGRKWSEK